MCMCMFNAHAYIAAYIYGCAENGHGWSVGLVIKMMRTEEGGPMGGGGGGGGGGNLMTM